MLNLRLRRSLWRAVSDGVDLGLSLPHTDILDSTDYDLAGSWPPPQSCVGRLRGRSLVAPDGPRRGGGVLPWVAKKSARPPFTYPGCVKHDASVASFGDLDIRQT